MPRRPRGIRRRLRRDRARRPRPPVVDLGSYATHLAEALRSTLAPEAALELSTGAVEVSVKNAASVCLILNELLTNALKYGRAGAGPTRVEVALSETGRRVRLIVRDHGPGLPTGF